MTILEEFDNKYKKDRSGLISEHYNKIISKELHEQMNSELLNKVSLTNVKEIIKFDFKTNVNITGDRIITIRYIDVDSQIQNLFMVLNTEDWNSIRNDQENYIEITDKRLLISDNTFELIKLRDMFFKFLDIFHRGYTRIEDK